MHAEKAIEPILAPSFGAESCVKIARSLGHDIPNQMVSSELASFEVL